MPVDVARSNRKEEDPLDKLMKVTSLGIGIAGVAQKSNNGAMDRRLQDLKSEDAYRSDLDKPVGKNNYATR